jgi:glycosyltransferase involved in cell wall biosynthesis
MNSDLPAVRQMIKELNSMLPTGKTPRDLNIIIQTATISNRALNRIYNQTYCGVLPTLGEAWSLFPCQLAAVGRPTITTAFGGHLDYLNYLNSYLISLEGFGPIDNGHKSAVAFYNNVTFPIPDVDHLTHLLDFTYHHPRDVERRGRRARHRVLSHFTWDMAADKVYKRILQICTQLSTS